MGARLRRAGLKGRLHPGVRRVNVVRWTSISPPSSKPTGRGCSRWPTACSGLSPRQRTRYRAWIRLNRSDAENIDNLGAWLTTVVSRVCLGMLRSRRSQLKELLEPDEPKLELAGPEEEAVLADTIGPALLLVLEALSPSERLAFVLHDLFAVPFEDIAPIVDRSPAAARQLASRARRRIQGGDDVHAPDRRLQQEVVEAFLAASRLGTSRRSFMLDPDVVLRADHTVLGAAANSDRGSTPTAFPGAWR